MGQGQARSAVAGGARVLAGPWRRSADTEGMAVAQLRDDLREHGPALLAFARRALGDPQLAEEVVQDTLVRAWRNADRFDPARAARRTWLFSICRNAVIDAARARSRRPVSPVEQLPAAVDERSDAELDARLTQLAVGAQLEAALRELSDVQRHAVVEVHVRDRAPSEVAAELGVPAATVRTRLHAGLRALRQRLHEEGWHRD